MIGIVAEKNSSVLNAGMQHVQSAPPVMFVGN